MSKDKKSAEQPSWFAFGEAGDAETRLAKLGDPPPWRKLNTRRQHIAESYRVSREAKMAVNAALYLRRPLLVTGPPGSGKSSLAEAVARDLDLGKVLRWPINSRSTLNEGLYGYDVIARLHDVQVKAWQRQRAETTNTRGADPGAEEAEDLGPYIRLNALGTALYGNPEVAGKPTKPRVLLIDEIDKSDIDLPNDLLHVLEEGEFEITELARVAARKGKTEVEVETMDLVGEAGAGGRRKVPIKHGLVACRVFPFVVITSNGERDLPPAFLRRCLQLNIAPAVDVGQLAELVEAHLKSATTDEAVKKLIATFRDKRSAQELLANDQLLNAVFLILNGQIPDARERDAVIALVLRELNP